MNILIFTVAQLISVIISTIKSIKTIDDSPLTASLWNALSYTIGAVVTKLLIANDFTTIILVGLTTNLTGVYLAKYILNKQKPDKIWSITATINQKQRAPLEYTLKQYHLKYTIIPALNSRFWVSVYAHTKGESQLIFDTLNNLNIKYGILEHK